MLIDCIETIVWFNFQKYRPVVCKTSRFWDSESHIAHHSCNFRRYLYSTFRTRELTHSAVHSHRQKHTHISMYIYMHVCLWICISIQNKHASKRPQQSECTETCLVFNLPFQIIGFLWNWSPVTLQASHSDLSCLLRKSNTDLAPSTFELSSWIMRVIGHKAQKA